MKKLADFELLKKKAFNIIENQEHLTRQGLEKIVALRLSSNRCRISPELGKTFPNIYLADRPLVLDKNIPDPY